MLPLLKDYCHFLSYDILQSFSCFVQTFLLIIHHYGQILCISLCDYLSVKWTYLISESRIRAPAPGEDPMGEDSSSSYISSSSSSSSSDEEEVSEAEEEPHLLPENGNPAQVVPPFRLEHAEREAEIKERILRLEEGEARCRSPIPENTWPRSQKN